MISAPINSFFIVLEFGAFIFPFIKSNIVDGVKFEIKHKFVKDIFLYLTI